MFVPKKTFVKLVGIVLAICSCLGYTSIAQANTHVHSRTSSVCSQRWTSGAYYGNMDRTIHFADVNGDGRADAIVINQDGVYVALSIGNSFTTPQKWTSGAYYGNMDRTVHFADVNGDGRAEAIVVNNDGITVATSTWGNYFDTIQKWKVWTRDAYYGNVDRTVHFADVNGDGKADAIVVNQDGVHVALGAGSSFGC